MITPARIPSPPPLKRTPPSLRGVQIHGQAPGSGRRDIRSLPRSLSLSAPLPLFVCRFRASRGTRVPSPPRFLRAAHGGGEEPPHVFVLKKKEKRGTKKIEEKGVSSVGASWSSSATKKNRGRLLKQPRGSTHRTDQSRAARPLSARVQKGGGCNTRTSREVTHPSTTLAQARLTAEF